VPPTPTPTPPTPTPTLGVNNRPAPPTEEPSECDPSISPPSSRYAPAKWMLRAWESTSPDRTARGAKTYIQAKLTTRAPPREAAKRHQGRPANLRTSSSLRESKRRHRTGQLDSNASMRNNIIKVMFGRKGRAAQFRGGKVASGRRIRRFEASKFSFRPESQRNMA
jgi:hypothetical protein